MFFKIVRSYFCSLFISLKEQFPTYIYTKNCWMSARTTNVFTNRTEYDDRPTDQFMYLFFLALWYSFVVAVVFLRCFYLNEIFLSFVHRHSSSHMYVFIWFSLWPDRAIYSNIDIDLYIHTHTHTHRGIIFRCRNRYDWVCFFFIFGRLIYSKYFLLYWQQSKNNFSPCWLVVCCF